jgi:hypothetical protein
MSGEPAQSWRFIAYYLIRGPWKQGVLGGIDRLADGHALREFPPVLAFVSTVDATVEARAVSTKIGRAHV